MIIMESVIQVARYWLVYSTQIGPIQRQFSILCSLMYARASVPGWPSQAMKSPSALLFSPTLVDFVQERVTGYTSICRVSWIGSSSRENVTLSMGGDTPRAACNTIIWVLRGRTEESLLRTRRKRKSMWACDLPGSVFTNHDIGRWP